jgi:hypothetical protein
VRATGEIELFPDAGAEWTTRITEKYVRGEGRAVSVASRAADERVAIRLAPVRIVAVASV